MGIDHTDHLCEVRKVVIKPLFFFSVAFSRSIVDIAHCNQVERIDILSPKRECSCGCEGIIRTVRWKYTGCGTGYSTHCSSFFFFYAGWLLYFFSKRTKTYIKIKDETIHTSDRSDRSDRSRSIDHMDPNLQLRNVVLG